MSVPERVQEIRREIAQADGGGLAPGKEYSAQRNGDSIRSTLPPGFCEEAGVEKGVAVKTYVDYNFPLVVIVPVAALKERDSL